MEDIKRIINFRNYLNKLGINDLKNPIIMRELAITFNLIGDIMNMIKLPHGTRLSSAEFDGSERYYKNKKLAQIANKRLERFK